MKRYSQILDKNTDGTLQAKMYIAEFGEWVKWEDVELQFKASIGLIVENKDLRNEMKRLKTSTISNCGQDEAYKAGYFEGQHAVECNCGENATIKEYPHGLMPNYWICPAHGYKRR